MIEREWMQAARDNVHSLLEQCNVPYQVIPFDNKLYQECIDDAIQRRYPVDGIPSLRTYVGHGVVYAATAGRHIRHRPTQIWMALFVGCAIFVDDVDEYFPEEIPSIYLFHDRFIRKEQQPHDILETFADIMRRTSEFYQPLASHFIITSALNLVAANILEHETRSMKISGFARKYPVYQRILSGWSETLGFMIFPKEIPVKDYIQAIPEIRLFINNVNDILSFYKEELVGEPTNHISTLAACTNKSKLEILTGLRETTMRIYETIPKILEGSPMAYEAFECYVAGYFYFHTSLPRYRLEDLDL